MEKLQTLRPLLLIAAIVGFLAINVPFLYFALVEQETYRAAMTNGLALVFVGEAFLLMFFLAFVIARLGWKKPGWFTFILLSLLGSLAFSIPLFLFFKTRPESTDSAKA